MPFLPPNQQRQSTEGNCLQCFVFVNANTIQKFISLFDKCLPAVLTRL